MKRRAGVFCKVCPRRISILLPATSSPIHPPPPPPPHHSTCNSALPPHPQPEVSAHPGTGKCEVSGASVSIKGQDAFRDGQQPGFADWSLSVLSTHTSGTSGSAARKQRVYLCRRCPPDPPPPPIFCPLSLPPRSPSSPRRPLIPGQCPTSDPASSGWQAIFADGRGVHGERWLWWQSGSTGFHWDKAVSIC